MSQFHQFLASIQADRAICDEDVLRVSEHLAADDHLNLDDVKLLVELYCTTPSRSPKFDDLFFAVLERVFLSDGQISPSEEYYLLKMLYSDREIQDRERDFLERLRRQLPERTASFEALVETSQNSPSTNWCVGGRQT